MSAKGLKYDSNKPMISLICRETLEGMAAALKYGMDKYTVGSVSGRDNYKKGLAYNRVADSAMRHILAFIDGEDIDPESGQLHLNHALAALNMLMYQVHNNPDMDDRYKPIPAASPIAAEILNKYTSPDHMSANSSPVSGAADQYALLQEWNANNGKFK